VVAGLGSGALSSRLWAQSECSQAEILQLTPAQQGKWSDWEFYHPCQYDVDDAKVLNEFYAELDKINKRGEVNVGDLVAGKLAGTPGVDRTTKISPDSMMTIAKANVGTNPLFMDRDYARKTTYSDRIAFPLIISLEVMPAMPKTKGIGDYMVVSSHNDTNSYYKPVYEGDTLYTLIDEQRCIDITPAEGSFYRTFSMRGSARVFNQKGELVAEGANVLRESFRRHKDKAKRNPDGAHAWESPDWWSRMPYVYTDKDWETIIGIWKNEKVRGAEPLYWDEVKVGDELAPTAVGPLILNTQMDMSFTPPQYAIDIKKNVLDPAVFPKMVKNKLGIYVLPEYLEKKTGGGPEMPGGQGGAPGGGPGGGQAGGPGGAQAPAASNPMMAQPKTKEIAIRDGRAVFQNSVAAKFAAGMICNWMGDQGWLQRIGWDIMADPPGSDPSIDYDAFPTRIPVIPRQYMPPLFDKFPYLEKVPRMRGIRAAWHVLENDLVICRAYVTSKYQNKGEYFVDLSWWDETLDHYLVEEGFATVKLPKSS
jgi:acyl dehydratase